MRPSFGAPLCEGIGWRILPVPRTKFQQAKVLSQRICLGQACPSLEAHVQVGVVRELLAPQVNRLSQAIKLLTYGLIRHLGHHKNSLLITMSPCILTNRLLVYAAHFQSIGKR